MSYQYRGPGTIAAEEEAHVIAKFEYFRKAEAVIDAGPGVIEYQPAPIRKREASAKCGTHSGYKTHIIGKTAPCRECLDARAIYQREYRAGKRAA